MVLTRSGNGTSEAGAVRGQSGPQNSEQRQPPQETEVLGQRAPDPGSRASSPARSQGVRSAARSRGACSASSRRAKMLEYEAAERLVALRRRELQLEMELVNKKLACDLAIAEEEEDDQASRAGASERVDHWLQSQAAAAALPDLGESGQVCTPRGFIDNRVTNERTVADDSAAIAAGWPAHTYAKAGRPCTFNAGERARPPPVRPAEPYAAPPGHDQYTVRPCATDLHDQYAARPRAHDLHDQYAARPRAYDLYDQYTARPRAHDLYDQYTARPRAPDAHDMYLNKRSRIAEQIADTMDHMIRARNPPRQAADLPSFSGAPHEWLPFKAAMRDSTAMYDFTPAENLARLRNCLKGEAKETVAALLYTAIDARQIMRTLEQCYGRPEIIIDRALDDIRRLPRISGATSATELNTFAIKLQNIVCVMQNIDKKNYLLNPMFTREITAKLTPHLRSRWCDYAEEHEDQKQPEVVTLSEFLIREADVALKHAYAPQTTAAPAGGVNPMIQVPRTLRAPKNLHAQFRQASVNATTHEEVTQNSNICMCCSGAHLISACRQIEAMTVDERWEWAKGARLCFKCLSKRHRRQDCRARSCGVNGCRRPHHPVLHSEPSSPPTSPAEPEPAEAPEPTETVLAVSTERQEVLLKVCPVIVAGPNGVERSTFALLDEGSTTTLIDDELAQELGLTGPTRPFNIHGVNATQCELASRRVSVRVRGKTVGEHDESGTNREYELLEARTVKNLHLRTQSVPAAVLHQAHLKELNEHEVCYSNARPRLLIGADHWAVIASSQLLYGDRKAPAAALTKLGWVVYGNAPRSFMYTDGEQVLHVHTTRRPAASMEDIDALIRAHYDADALGVSLTVKKKPEDERARCIFEHTAKRVDGRFEVGLPWRDDCPVMPENHASAYRRLRGIERRLDRDPALRTEYNNQVNNLLIKGYAEPSDGSEQASSVCWYLPHFAVRNPNKPGKMRLVFDAAAVCGGTSLNNNLLDGPDLLQPLLGILFRFRERPVAVTADIREMFLQVKIRKEDQPAQMFLWRGEDRKNPPKKYKMTSLIFGARSSPFLAHSVRDANARDYAHSHPRAHRVIVRSHYMDDMVHSFQTEQEAIEVSAETEYVHSQAGFELRGWNSNSHLVLASFPPEKRAREPTSLGEGENYAAGRTLGLLWHAEQDELGFNTSMPRVPREVCAGQRAPTKREALSAVMSVFDPLGLLSHYTITAKILLQDLWRCQLGWDEPVPPEAAEKFIAWAGNLKSIAELRLPRYYGGDTAESIELHVFCDASEQAYAAAAYYRITHRGDEPTCVLVAAKAKVAPLRPLSIPRLELQAALIGARLAQIIIAEHDRTPDRTVYWTDSRTVLQWIRTDARRYTPYVAHRLGEIAELTTPSQWRWLPSADNVADDATRALNPIPERAGRWFSGPAFLTKGVWPAEDPSAEHDEEEVASTCHVGTTERWLPDIRRFSSYERLIRATARALYFIDRCRRRTTIFDVAHMERAEAMWLRSAQEESFGAEMARLRAVKALPRASRLARLDPVLGHDGLLRLRGRIGAADVPAASKQPVILDGRHELARLIILREHCASNHANRERVGNELRQRYWLLHLRPTVRAVARHCALCRLRRAVPSVPSAGDLPAARLQAYARPFTNAGIDYFGPLVVRVGRRREKRWCALFTCLTTRAIHLEVVNNLSTDAAIMALRRMAARRGWPRTLYSDNGTNFRGADSELRAAYAEWEPELRNFGLLHRLQWRFIPPGAPNQGGAWERLVRSVKTALSAVLTEKEPKEDVLRTVLAEVEFTVNSRPLTHVSVEHDADEALTPNHFLLGSSGGLPYTGQCEIADRRGWRAAQALADEFWRRWVREYLPTLAARGEQTTAGRNVTPGDLVVIMDHTLPRNLWPRGVVTAVYPGPDGVVRNVDVRTRGGIFKRPVRRLAVLAKAGCDGSSPGGGCCGQPAEP